MKEVEYPCIDGSASVEYPRIDPCARSLARKPHWERHRHVARAKERNLRGGEQPRDKTKGRNLSIYRVDCLTRHSAQTHQQLKYPCPRRTPAACAAAPLQTGRRGKAASLSRQSHAGPRVGATPLRSSSEGEPPNPSTIQQPLSCTAKRLVDLSGGEDAPWTRIP